jgi:hypothetical protein
MGAGHGDILLCSATQPHDVVPKGPSPNAVLSPGVPAFT